MKKLLGLASALVGLATLTPAYAAPPFHTVTMSATVQNNCTVGGSASAISGAFSAVTASTSNFAVDVTGTTANATSGELALGTITCTSPQMRITLTPSGWIKPTAGTPEITYSAYLKNGTQDLNSGNSLINSAVGTGPKNVVFNGTTLALRLAITTNQATSLIAGSYTATLAISVDPV
jgi:hypothetical protein